MDTCFGAALRAALGASLLPPSFWASLAAAVLGAFFLGAGFLPLAFGFSSSSSSSSSSSATGISSSSYTDTLASQ